jgi:hypothetical protein
MEKGWGSNSPSTPAPGTVRPTPENPEHKTHYDATDARRDKGAANGWASVDGKSGIMSAEDWSHVTSDFPDSGPWKQT